MRIIGHRGARGLAPENTLVSLQKALQHGVDELEFDLRVTQDSQVILHHDPFITDPDGTRHIIKDNSYAVLKEHKPDLATLSEVFKAFGTSVPLLIEVKPDEPTAPIITIIKARIAERGHTNQLLLGSFSQKTLLELHRALPEIQKVVIESWSGARATRRAKQVNTKRLNMNYLWLWRPFIQPMAKRGWQLSAYTLNDPAKANRWAKYGLFGVITDYPDRFEKP